MSTRLKNILNFTVFFLLGLALIWWAVKDIPAEKQAEIWIALKGVNPLWLALSVFLAALSHLSRSIRWRMMLEPFAPHAQTKNTFLTLMSGYLVNLAVPRLGEIVRCALLEKFNQVSFKKSIGTVVTERGIDFIVLLVISFVTVLLQWRLVGSFTKQNIVEPLLVKLGYIHPAFYLLGLGVTLGILFFLLKIGLRSSSRIKDLLKDFGEGVISVARLQNKWAFAIHTAFIWLMYFLMVYVCFFSMGETSELDGFGALSLLAFGTFGFIITPGGIGAYPLVVSAVLVVYGIPYEIGLAFGWIIWLVQTFFVIVGGFISFVLLSLLNPSQAL